MVLFLPGTPFIPFYFINPYSSLKIQLRCHFLLLPGWIRYFILLYISIRVISTLNQFIFISMTRLHVLRAKTVSCLPHLPSTLEYSAYSIWQQFSYLKHMQEAEQNYTYRTLYLLYSVTWLSKTEKYRNAILVRK